MAIEARYLDGESMLPTPDASLPHDARYVDGESVIYIPIATAAPTGSLPPVKQHSYSQMNTLLAR